MIDILKWLLFIIDAFVNKIYPLDKWKQYHFPTFLFLAVRLNQTLSNCDRKGFIRRLKMVT